MLYIFVNDFVLIMQTRNKTKQNKPGFPILYPMHHTLRPCKSQLKLPQHHVRTRLRGRAHFRNLFGLSCFLFCNFSENSLRAVSSATKIKQNKLQTPHDFKNYVDTI